ncbi:hypothetical protein CC80DRAFT_61329 [Byssothecium circinans]|uniref:Uncharacterized protein n=1 Tax=Byssothecium circinans TaxID=147558 RepID=A0A6A5TVF1_9PLEO|nr:hypothetical protein CC80DRAFT_61329 [Byssothecium circinans]
MLGCFSHLASAFTWPPVSFFRGSHVWSLRSLAPSCGWAVLGPFVSMGVRAYWLLHSLAPYVVRSPTFLLFRGSQGMHGRFIHWRGHVAGSPIVALRAHQVEELSIPSSESVVLQLSQ